VFSHPRYGQLRAMHLSPREIDHLQLAQVGQLAQKRLARGLRLNHPEAVALISAQLMERIRDGENYVDLMSLGQRMLGTRQVRCNAFGARLFPSSRGLSGLGLGGGVWGRSVKSLTDGDQLVFGVPRCSPEFLK